MGLKEQLVRKGDYIWVLPEGSVEKQKVPVVLYISPALFELLEEEALKQAANAATLKGVQKAIYVMPDVHVGYGFPVGGVMATDAEEGIISPGSVGYDINCLPEGTRVLSSFGYAFRIEDFRGEKLLGLSQEGIREVQPVLHFRKRAGELIRIRTSLGYTLRLTPDHPVLTKSGMREAERIEAGTPVAIYPFRGIEYEEPEDLKLLETTGNPQADAELEERELLPLSTGSEKLPYLLRLMGYTTLRGSLRKGYLHITCRPEEREEVFRDLTALGLPVEGNLLLRVESEALPLLLSSLGVEPGAPSPKVPPWIFRLPLWMKRLYVSGLLGAGMEDLSLGSPSPELLEDTGRLLLEMGVSVRIWRGVLRLRTRVDNLQRFCEAVSFAYSPVKRKQAFLRALSMKGEVPYLLKASGFEDTRIMPHSGDTRSDILWDRVVEVEEEPYEGWVYDFTVREEEHNFIAQNFVVSNCGVRLIATNLRGKEVEPHIRKLMEEILKEVPAGVGSRGEIRLSKSAMGELLQKGARWAVEHGYGPEEDLAHIESGGTLADADPDKASPEAYQRGSDELGTVGSGNHFVEVQRVEEVYDPRTASLLGLKVDQVVVLVHSGSRGFGHQVCTDYLKTALKALPRYGIELPDPQLACIPFSSPEGQDYFRAMCAAANYAFANRQILGFKTLLTVRRFFGLSWEDLGYRLIYDHAHNIAKLEEHRVNGKLRRVVVHRKGATRAFPPLNPEVPPAYRDIGQPVLIPGDMGRASYLLVGQDAAMDLSFGTACHGAGRLMSRRQAKKLVKEKGFESVIGDLVVVARGKGTIMEEIPEAYKDVSEVVRVIHELGIARMVARLKPLGTLKG